MGFENRKSARVNTSFNLFFWTGGVTTGLGHWGLAINLSETGMAFVTQKDVPKGEMVLMEMTLPGRHKPTRLFAVVMHSNPASAGQVQLRVKFENLETEERHLLNQHVLEVADPKLASVTGWGKALFTGADFVEARYRALDAAAEKDKAFITWKEVSYLKNFQLFLELFLGAKLPSSFKLVGTRPMKDQAAAWVELNLEAGQLHVMARVLWCSHDPGDKAEMGMSMLGVRKDEAVRLEKGA